MNCPHGYLEGVGCAACGFERKYKAEWKDGCPHARLELFGPRQRDGVRCADCGAQFAMRLSPGAAALLGVVVCPHGVASDAATPCFPCIAATLERGKEARALVHAIASCDHSGAIARGDSWCAYCGASSGLSGVRLSGELVHAWKVPHATLVAKELDAPAASSGPPPDAPTADSAKKSDT